MGRLVLVTVLLTGGCGMEPSNIDMGLHVEADVFPREVSLSDTAGTLTMAILVSNPTDRDIIIETGGPPFRFTGDPTESQGLSASLRIASASKPLNAGPSIDWWGASRDTIRARRGVAFKESLTLKAWRAGWTVEPGVYRVRSYYNGREGESESFAVRP